MASTYKAYLGEGLGPLEWIKQFQIPHPGRVIGRAVLHLTMPAVLEWVLGGNNGHLARARPSACRVEDKLKVGCVVGVGVGVGSLCCVGGDPCVGVCWQLTGLSGWPDGQAACRVEDKLKVCCGV
jgi:hypothetical protein